MKKIIFLIILSIFLSCNPEDENMDIKVKIQYPGEYYIFFINWFDAESGNVAIIHRENTFECTEKYITDDLWLGELNLLQISAQKTYEPYNDELMIKLYMGDNILDSAIAEEGIREAELFYQF